MSSLQITITFLHSRILSPYRLCWFWWTTGLPRDLAYCFPFLIPCWLSPLLNCGEGNKNLFYSLRFCIWAPGNETSKRQTNRRRDTQILCAVNSFMHAQRPSYKRNEDPKKWLGLRACITFLSKSRSCGNITDKGKGFWRQETVGRCISGGN